MNKKFLEEALQFEFNETPSIEFDSFSNCIYVRFLKDEIDRTIDFLEDSTVMVDLNSRGKVVGIEMTEIDEISVRKIEQKLESSLKDGFSKLKSNPSFRLEEAPLRAMEAVGF